MKYYLDSRFCDHCAHQRIKESTQGDDSWLFVNSFDAPWCKRSWIHSCLVHVNTNSEIGISQRSVPLQTKTHSECSTVWGPVLGHKEVNVINFYFLPWKRGTWGGSEHCNTVKKFNKHRITAKNSTKHRHRNKYFLNVCNLQSFLSLESLLSSLPTRHLNIFCGW